MTSPSSMICFFIQIEKMSAKNVCKPRQGSSEEPLKSKIACCHLLMRLASQALPYLPWNMHHNNNDNSNNDNNNDNAAVALDQERCSFWRHRAFSICAPQLWNALPRELRVCDSIGCFKKALMKTFLFKKAYCWVKLRQTFSWMKLEIGPKILRSYLSCILFFKAIFNFLRVWNACGLLRNKRYINKLLLILLLITITRTIKIKKTLLTSKSICHPWQAKTCKQWGKKSNHDSAPMGFEPTAFYSGVVPVPPFWRWGLKGPKY